MCDHNKKFLFFVLKSSDVLEVLVPILYHLNDARADQCKFSWGVMAERIRALKSSSGVCVQQRVGLSPGHETCVLELDTYLIRFNKFLILMQRSWV